MDPHPENEIELSVVIPCLNEEDTLDVCIGKALQAMEKEGVAGEVIVAENGSTDGSLEIARKRGVRIVTVEEPGYGCALMGGIDVARGTYVIMGDADDSYDFLEIPKFLEIDSVRQKIGDPGPIKLRTIFPHTSVLSKPPQLPYGVIFFRFS